MNLLKALPKHPSFLDMQTRCILTEKKLSKQLIQKSIIDNFYLDILSQYQIWFAAAAALLNWNIKAMGKIIRKDVRQILCDLGDSTKRSDCCNNHTDLGKIGTRS